MAFPPVNPAIDRALADQGYLEPTPVQLAVLEAEAEGRDLLVSAQTGSGKTVAFGMAMAPTLLGEAERFGEYGAPLALIIAPTRELALQVSRELTWLYAKTGAIVVSCVGGMDARSEQRTLNRGCHIVVGTPGRLRDHLERGHLDLSSLKVAVLDEADEMLDLGFRGDLEFILEATPAERRTLLFSATIAKDIATLARTFQRDAVRIDTTTRNAPHGDIEYRAIRIAPNEIEHAVVNVLRHFDAGGALVFCATRDAVRHLHSSLRERGFEVVGLSGEMGQRERNDALQSLRDRRARVCVATDVAARGLDLPDLGLVIHADLPVNKAALLHRSGRTGRAGKKGVSVLLVPYTRRRKAEMLIGSAGVEAVWSGPPSAEEIRAGDTVRMLNDPTLTETPSEEDLTLARTLMEGKSAEEIATALVRMYRARLPEPEDLYDGGDRGAGRPERAPRAFDDGGERGARDHGEFADASWFRLSIGRSKNADPKWILPLICRLGHVTKKDIGQIRIFDNETKFQISEEMSPRFAEAVKATAADDIKVTPSTMPTSKDFGPKKKFADRPDRGPRPERAERPARPEWKDRPEKPAFAERAPRPDKPAYADRAPRAEAPARESTPYVKPRVAREDRPAAPARPKREYDRPRDAAVPYRPEAQPDRAPFKKPRASDSKGPRESAPYVPAGAAPERPAFKKKRPFEGGPRTDFKKPEGASAARGAFQPGGDFKGKAKPGIEKSFKGPKKPFKPKNKGNDWKP
ncbi:MAG: DEAD/DEAH box helicase [Caulobacterales bacterium]|nr:DEAD/DEAH box helicase [Caulobacterales bacterium]